jgi:hypothetical protein
MHTPYPHAHQHHFTHKHKNWPTLQPPPKPKPVTLPVSSSAYTYIMSNGYTTCSASTVSKPSTLINNYFANISIPPHLPNPKPKPYFTKNFPGGSKTPPHLRRGWTRRPLPTFCILSPRWQMQEGHYTTTKMLLAIIANPFHSHFLLVVISTRCFFFQGIGFTKNNEMKHCRRERERKRA